MTWSGESDGNAIILQTSFLIVLFTEVPTAAIAYFIETAIGNISAYAVSGFVVLPLPRSTFFIKKNLYNFSN